MPRRCPDVSSLHRHRGRDLRCCALGKTDAGYGWLRVQLEQPGVLLLRCLGPRRAEGSDGRHVRARWFGVPCRISRPAMAALTWPGLMEWQTIMEPIAVCSCLGAAFGRTRVSRSGLILG
jgi:hypothetical protein